MREGVPSNKPNIDRAGKMDVKIALVLLSFVSVAIAMLEQSLPLEPSDDRTNFRFYLKFLPGG